MGGSSSINGMIFVRVHGIDKLRGIDASIMPEITNGNLNAPVLMIAEKISQSILDGE